MLAPQGSLLQMLLGSKALLQLTAAAACDVLMTLR